MRKAGWLWLLPVVVLTIFSVAGKSTDAPVTIIYTGASFCKLKPCACSPESDLGGILRRDTALDDLLRRYPEALLLDAGNTFKEPTVQGKLGAIALVESLKVLGYDAVAIGPSDLIFGREFIERRSGGLLFVSNLRWKNVDSPLVVPSRSFKIGRSKIDVSAIIEPADVYTGTQANVEVDDPLGFLDRHARRKALTVVLISTEPEKAHRLLKHPKVDVVINAQPAAKIQDTPSYEFTGGKVYAEAGIFGSRVGVLKVVDRRGALLSAENEFIELKKDFRDGVRVKPFCEQYEAEVKELFLKSFAGKPAFDKDKSPYVGSEACAGCHAESFEVWRGSRHARAWDSLKEVGKTFDPECISCHVVGFGKEGGFHSEQDSPHLAGVGCEACHGPGKAHVGEGGGKMAPFTLRDCVVCHTNERSAAFELDSYWKEIEHK